MLRFKLHLIALIFIPFSSLHQQDTNGHYITISDISYYSHRDTSVDAYIHSQCRLDLYYPTHRDDFATIIWFHGGGLKGGTRYIPEGLLQQDIAVAAVSYRLYPKVKNPVYIEDAAAAVFWVFNHISAYGGNTDGIFLSGHSAGGYLILMLGMDKHWLGELGIDTDRIAGLISFSGHTITHFTIREELGLPRHQPLIDEFAPLFHVRSDAPPLLLITGDRDLELLGRFEENAYMARMMKVAGHQSTLIHELKGYDHGTMIQPALSLLIDFVNDHLREQNESPD